jgi:SAM-dependent methyltransferase
MRRMGTSELYTGGDYLERNPDWHVADSAWKCDRIEELLHLARGLQSVCEVGCGAGEILRQLHDRHPSIGRLVGYEIARAPYEMALERSTDRLSFVLGDAAQDPETFDLMLIMDVIEHVPDPIGFLADLRFKARTTFVHIPLDLSAQSVVRPTKLMSVRAKVGHIHYFTLETALATLTDAGYTVRGHVLTRSFDLPPGSLKARLALLPRRVLPPMLTARVLGGYSVLVAASNQ